MSRYSLREETYNAIDMFLTGLENGKFESLEEFHPEFAQQPYHHLMTQILGQFKLITSVGSKNLVGRISNVTKYAITVKGMNAIDAGGIREYLIDNDEGTKIHNGYPKVVTIYTDQFIVAKYLVISQEDEHGILEDHEGYKFKERYSRRNNSHTSPPTSNTSFNIRTVGSIVKDSTQTIHGNVTSTGAVQNRNPSNPNPESRGWKWTERYSWIAGIVAAVVAVIAILYEVYWKK